MAYTVTSLTTTWTLVGNNVTTFSFQNQGSTPIYIAVTPTNTPPAAGSFGWFYDYGSGERKVSAADLNLAGGTYVWARLAGGAAGKIMVDS